MRSRRRGGNPSSLGRPAASALALWLALRASAGGAADFKVGSFAKSTSTAPTSQSVAHGLGQAPKALIFWTVGRTGTTFAAHHTWAIGFSDLTTERSMSSASQDAVGTSNASRRVAAKAITIVQSSASTAAEASVSSVDATNFTLNWSTNDTNATIIQFLAIGGAGVRAKVTGWTAPTTTGNASVTGVGFTPSVVLHANVGGLTGSPPTSGANAGLGLGAMDAAGHEWAIEALATDTSGFSDTQRDQVTDAAVVVIDNSPAVAAKGSFVSMDTDGFTMNFPTVSGSAFQIASLALAGLRANVGTFAKTTSAATASQSVSGIGFRPLAILLASNQLTSGSGPSADARLGIGVSDGTTQGAAALSDDDAQDTTDVEAVHSTSKTFIKVNNSTQTTNAECTTASFDNGGYTLSWTTNDASATEICYVALGTRRVMISTHPRPHLQARPPRRPGTANADGRLAALATPPSRDPRLR